MMKSATSFSRSGLSDWLIQRVSAGILGVYFVVVLGFILLNHDMSFETWHDFMLSGWMRVFNLLALLSLVAHAWIGMWTVLTDYVTTRQMGSYANVLRILLQVAMGIMIFILVVWGIQIFWGN